MSDAAKAYELPKEGASEVEGAIRQGDRVLVTRDGVTLAAIVPLEDLKALEALEDEADEKFALAALADWEARGRPAGIPFDEALVALGLTRDDLSR